MFNSFKLQNKKIIEKKEDLNYYFDLLINKDLKNICEKKKIQIPKSLLPLNKELFSMNSEMREYQQELYNYYLK